MRSSQQTLLASLGFADPDKKNWDHDLACQYLGQKQVATKIVNLFARKTYPEAKKFEILSSQHEVLIPIGHSVGFLDLVIRFAGYFSEEEPKFASEIAVEVKIGEIQIGDAIRHINLYKASRNYLFVLVTAFGLRELEIAELKASEILHLQLGRGFEEFKQQQQAAPAHPSVEI